MDLQRFIKDQHKRLDKFEAYWEKRAGRDPKLFSTNLEPGEWEQQLTSWLINQPKEETK